MSNPFNIEQFVTKVVIPAKKDKDGKDVKGAKSSTVYEFSGFVTEIKPSRKEAALGRKSEFVNFRAGKNSINKLCQGFEKYGVGLEKESYTKILDLSTEELHSGLKLYVKEIQEKNPEQKEIFRSILLWLRDDSKVKDAETNPLRTCLNLFCSILPYEKLDLSDSNRAAVFGAWKQEQLDKIAEMEKMAGQISEEDAMEYAFGIFGKYGVDDKGYLRFKAASAPATPPAAEKPVEKAEEKAEEKVEEIQPTLS